MSSTPTIPLRSIAQALEKHLHAIEDANIHWINVVGESSVLDKPKKSIPLDVLSTHLFNVLVQHGWSEGTLLYVSSQQDRYAPQEQTLLLQIKSLTSIKKIGPEVAAIMDWFESEARSFLTEADQVATTTL